APLRVVEPPLEAPQLLFLDDVQEELEDKRVVVREEVLERVQLVIPLRQVVLRDQVVDLDDEYVLVVGPVKDDDLSLLGQEQTHPPQVIVRRLLRSWFLERR